MSATGLVSCDTDATSASTQTLLASEDAAFVCAQKNAAGVLEGRPIGECPSSDSAGPALYSLVTQPETGEVALLDMSDCADGSYCVAAVQDLEVTQPGINFLPVGAEPGSIVSTPGGMASFVGIREAGREGIFALPTSCVGPRPETQSMRDLRTWPACRLPVAPGAMAMVVDPLRDASCTGAVTPVASDAECPADLSEEGPGRRELLVALPSLGEVWAIDAQALVNRPAGSFDACPVDAVLPLSAARPTSIEQQVPADLAGADSCGQVGTQYPIAQADFQSIPADFAITQDRLYVADTGAPVVHVVDLTDTCQLKELAPLLPVSFTQPGLVVPTRKVAVSPLSPKGEQFVYAIDDSAGVLGGSVMVFDVSPGKSDKTPLVRERSELITDEPPDRIRLTEEAADIEFAHYERTVSTGDTPALEGVRCDPDPTLTAAESQAVLYRPTSAGDGANPTNLRGLFGFILLQSGRVAVVDVDDLDAACRRTSQVNTGSTPDARGCAEDPWSSELRDAKNVLTVTDETTCHIVEPHRVRSFGMYSHDPDEGSAPKLRGMPLLRSSLGGSLVVDTSEQGVLHPKLLGMPYAGVTEHRVYLDGTELSTGGAGNDRLELNPALADRGSVLLPETEPRAYDGSGETFVAEYEGLLRSGLVAPVTRVQTSDLSRAPELPESEYARLSVPGNALYCAAGVEDELVAQGRGLDVLPWASGKQPTQQSDLSSTELARLEAFGVEHADYVSVTSELLDSKDAYWEDAGAECGVGYLAQDPKNPNRNVVPADLGYHACELTFGPENYLASRNTRRDFRIVRAFNDELIVEPRGLEGANAAELQASREARLAALACCFPTAVQFEVRASKHWVFSEAGVVPHAIRTNPDTLACERRSCDPLLRNREGRVYEVACTDNSCNGVGRREPAGSADTTPCVLPAGHSGPLLEGELPDACFLDALTARFVVYRGQEPSARGMTFSWATSGGFTPLVVNTTSQGTTSPRRLSYIPQVNRMFISDGGSRGVALLGLRSADGSSGFDLAIAK